MFPVKLSLLEGFDRQVRDFVAARSIMGECRFTDGDRGFAVVDGNNRLAAGVVFSNWVPSYRSIELSGAAVHNYALSPQIVQALGQYAFGQLECWRVWARTSVKNDRARRLLKHIGFCAEAVHHSFYGPGRHAETFRMLRPDWDKKYGPLEAREAA